MQVEIQVECIFAREGDGIERRRHCGVGDGCCAAKVTALGDDVGGRCAGAALRGYKMLQVTRRK